MSTSRRAFLRSTAAVAVGFSGLQRLVAAERQPDAARRVRGFGQLVADPERMLDLPAGFSYRVISRRGDAMDDGLLVPDKPDGMAAFAGPDGLTLLVRNHEIDQRQPGPFGERSNLLDNVDQSRLYDVGGAGTPCLGGTTTLVYDTRRRRTVRQYLSLGGTIRNCAGGPTPWGTWITCEEASDRVGDNFWDGERIVCQQNHGYNFEVPASAEPQLYQARPLKAMGRFRHEAVAVEPKSGIVYQTEDVEDGLIYRFLPAERENLAAGGRLQALALMDQASADTRNWDEPTFSVGQTYDVRWIDLEDIDSPHDDLRLRGFSDGAARFARGEGMWWAGGSVYFACTNGGRAKLGQIWRYTPSDAAGQPGEQRAPGKIELFIEPNDSRLVVNADNLTAAPWGDLIICEDRDGDEVRLVGVTPAGGLYTLANCHLDSELAGAVFSPDGTTLLVNIQHAGLTLAITGPWKSAT